MADSAGLRPRLAAAGIGYAGLDGAWWLPAREPFTLPRELAVDLAGIGRALFALFDAVDELYRTPDGQAAGLDDILEYKTPAHITGRLSPGRVLQLRPDFQLAPRAGGGYQCVATELEMCPSAHGFAHAMQAAYGLEPDLAPAFAHFLDGRELLFAGTHEWGEFLIEQLAFCRALEAGGARARVLYDRPLEAIAREFQAGQRWQPPMFGVKARPAGWDTDLMSRLSASDLLRFAHPGWRAPAGDWPDEVGGAVVFRFGYVDGFAPETLRRFEQWAARGATLLNPPRFYLDSKAVLAAASLPVVRARLAARDPEAPAVLERCLPETRMLREPLVEQLLDEQSGWVLKFAGFAADEQAWGGRSLQIGPALDRADWAATLRRYLALPWPVVAQRLTPSIRVDLDYVAADGAVQALRGGHTRLRSFLLRAADGVVACGSHLTASGAGAQVSEATDAVQAPVAFV